MNITKSRKRLTAIILSFMLVFATGTAFALGTGTLNVTGSVRLNQLDGELLITGGRVTGPLLVPTAPTISPDGQSASWNLVIQPSEFGQGTTTGVLTLDIENTSPVFGATVNMSSVSIDNFRDMGMLYIGPWGSNSFIVPPMGRNLFSVVLYWNSDGMDPNFDLNEAFSFDFDLNWQLNP